MLNLPDNTWIYDSYYKNIEKETCEYSDKAWWNDVTESGVALHPSSPPEKNGFNLRHFCSKKIGFDVIFQAMYHVTHIHYKHCVYFILV